MIPLQGLSNRPYAVLGLGLSGRATCHALLAGGREVRAWDDNAGARDAAIRDGIPLTDLSGVDLATFAALILSPGIPHTYPRPHPVAARAKEVGCPIIGDGELLAQSDTTARYIGITGTNGKSTTTALIGHILKCAGEHVQVGGNLGTPMLAFEPMGATGTYVIEMSSYQLELTPNLVFNASVLLNISADHLDRHGGMNGYIAAKELIFRGQPPAATAVVGVDDDASRRIAEKIRVNGHRRVIPVSGHQAIEGGVYAVGTYLYDATEGGPRMMFDLNRAIALPGTHNAQNAAAAYAVTTSLGVSAEQVVRSILDFPGLAHRQQRIDTLEGITFVNDSKATNADAAARALACYENIYWIAGGRPKGDGLGAVMPFIDRVRHVYLIGEAADAFASELTGKVDFSLVGTLDAAVSAAYAQARAATQEKAVVLLSPACASFDQFRNFEQRGEAFRTLVTALAQ